MVEASFKEKHGLDETQYKAVYEYANKRLAGMMPALAAEGMPVNEAFEQVLDTAFYSLPAMRELEWQRDAEQRKEDQVRKAKAGSLSGSSGSVPRTVPVELPRTEQGKRDALTSMARQMMNGEVE